MTKEHKSKDELRGEMGSGFEKIRSVLNGAYRVSMTALTISLLSLPIPALAQDPTSPSYRLDESSFSSGANVDLSSNTYRAVGGAGLLGIGNASSNSYDLEAGFFTENEPYLAMAVTGATVDFGTLDPSSYSSGAAQAGGCNCSFMVRTYISGSYSILSVSQPPTSENGDTIAAKAVLGVPSVSASVEEFGFNLVDNATPNIGANPSNQPSNSFADGEAGTGYDTADQFKYVVGDVIAQSAATAGNQAVGETYYTISYIAKPSNVTEAGVYTMRHNLVAVPTY